MLIIHRREDLEFKWSFISSQDIEWKKRRETLTSLLNRRSMDEKRFEATDKKEKETSKHEPYRIREELCQKEDAHCLMFMRENLGRV